LPLDVTSVEVLDTETLVDCERVPDEEGTDEVFDEETIDVEVDKREEPATDVVFETEIVVLETAGVEADVLRLEIDDRVFEDDRTELWVLEDSGLVELVLDAEAVDCDKLEELRVTAELCVLLEVEDAARVEERVELKAVLVVRLVDLELNPVLVLL
jgi:hypothetical protein